MTFTVHLKEYGMVMCLPFLLLQRATAQHLCVINPLLFPIDVSQGYKNSLRVYRCICAHAFPFSPYSHILYIENGKHRKQAAKNRMSSEFLRVADSVADALMGNNRKQKSASICFRCFRCNDRTYGVGMLNRGSASCRSKCPSTAAIPELISNTLDFANNRFT